eukprot:scaffold74257_cov42-Attheya_sp.AAC.2
MAMYAAAKGADVYMVCRSMSRAETARDEIIKKTSSDKVKILQVHNAVSTNPLRSFPSVK